MDRAGRAYWDQSWERAAPAQSADPADSGIQNHVVRQFGKLFDRHLRGRRAGSRIVEIGCANSAWLPYFAKRFGFRVAGLDYSSVGCLRTEQVLAREGVPGDIVCGDLFLPPNWMLSQFEVALSFGVVEHFEDTVHSVRAITDLVRPGGIVFTIIPNLAGVLGPLQRFINKPVYDVHVPLTARGLAEAHREAGLRVVASDYLVPINLGICNLSGLSGIRNSATGKVLRFLIRLSYFVWLLNEIHPLPATRVFAGYSYCIGERA